MSPVTETREAPTPGLTSLDEDRAQSMADEGGASAASWDGDDALDESRVRREGWILAALAGGVVALLAVAFFRRGR